jgi:hypothetical protein
MRYEEYVKKTVDDLINGQQAKADDFPEFELYMDQAITFMNKKLSAFKKDDKDMILTKTMVNNYTKHKMLPNPVNKKYTKDHLILLTMIYHLKKSFQMDDIEKLMKPLIDNYNSEFDDKIDFMNIYSGVLEVSAADRQNMLAQTKKDIENIKSHLNQTEAADDDMLEVFMLIMDLAMKANVQRMLAEKLLDEYFVKPSTQKIKKVKRPKIKFDSQGEVEPKKKTVKETNKKAAKHEKKPDKIG